MKSNCHHPVVVFYLFNNTLHYVWLFFIFPHPRLLIVLTVIRKQPACLFPLLKEMDGTFDDEYDVLVIVKNNVL